MSKFEQTVTLKVPVGIRLLLGELAEGTGESEASVLQRLVINEVVKQLLPHEAEAIACSK